MTDPSAPQQVQRPSPVRRFIGLSLLTASATVQLIYALTGLSPWGSPGLLAGISGACGILLLFPAHVKLPSMRGGPHATRVVPATLAWTTFCALTTLSVSLLTVTRGMNGYGLLHAHPFLFWALLAAFYGSFVCIPVLLLWGAWAAFTHRLGWLRFLGLLPLHAASVGVLWLVFYLDASTAPR